MNRLVGVQVNLPGVGNTGVDVIGFGIRSADKHVIPVVIVRTDPARIRRGQTEGRIVGDQVEGLQGRPVNHVEADGRLIAGRIVIAVNHAVRTGTHPETTGRVGRVVEVVVDNDTSAIRTRRNSLAVLNAEVGIRDDITVVRQARLEGLIAGQSRIIVCRRRRSRRVVRFDDPGHITRVVISRLNTCVTVVCLSGIQTANIEAIGGTSTTLITRTMSAFPSVGGRLGATVVISARLQLRRKCILHAQAAHCEAKDHEKCEELSECSPKNTAERILAVAH